MIVRAARHAAAFGKTIAELRRKLRISQEELAGRAGVHWTYVGQIERGLKSPTLGTIFKLAEGLDIKPSTILRKVERHL